MRHPATETISSADLEELRSSLRDFLATKADEQAVRATIETDRGWDAEVWAQLADQLGLTSMIVPTEYGGDGYGFRELRVVLEELGRALTPSPFLSTVVLAGSALVAADDPAAAASFLPSLAAGKQTATLAVAEADGLWDTANLNTRAIEVGDGWRLTGSKSFVLDGGTAELVLVVAGTEAGPTLFAVEGTASGLTRTSLQTLDLTRPLALLDFADTPATRVGTAGGADAVVARVLDLAQTALAAEQTGAARACLEASASYARDRRQFGRQIGSFQAVKHKCADMLVRVQLAQATAIEAAEAADGAPEAPPLAEAAAVAHAVCSEAFMFVATENIQVHGGIGFTWEHPAHLYYRRAKSSQLLFGGPAVYYERLLERFGV